ncbi:MAG: TauD/TfdA family dioxygenase [Pseudomonadales bacterium]|nr:TauD/TfdA family dioxygenase [Pseudomonadales bacterium]
MINPFLKEASDAAQGRNAAGAFPKIYQPHQRHDARVGIGLFREHGAALKQELREKGALLFRGCGVNSAEDFEAVLDAVPFENMPYLGGAAPRRQITHRRIMTANESPPDEKIPLHHEMAQTSHPPDYIFFYCDTAPTSGGATTVFDSRAAYDLLNLVDQSLAKQLETQGVRYSRVMPAITDPASPIGRSWQETFLVKTKPEAERVMQGQGLRWQWLNGDELRTESPILPAVRLDPVSGRKTFFNSVIAAFTGWNDTRNVGHRAVQLGGGAYLPSAVFEQFLERAATEVVNIPWRVGDMLWLDNRLVMHARQPFQGPRQIYTAIALDAG